MAKEVIHLPLKEIDPLCRRAVILFNLLGLRTQYCCSGHTDKEYLNRWYIIFDECVTDDQISAFQMDMFHYTHKSFPLVKTWTINSDTNLPYMRWMWEENTGKFAIENQRIAYWKTKNLQLLVVLRSRLGGLKHMDKLKVFCD